MKKLVNHPDHAARETIEGLTIAHPHLLRAIEGATAVLRRDAPVEGKVAVLTGGGSGHEPMFAGFLSAAAWRRQRGWKRVRFTAPASDLRAAKAVHGGSGVLFLYGNYAGDVLNFDMAAECASRPRSESRGIAGDLFVIKAAGARAEGAPTWTK